MYYQWTSKEKAIILNRMFKRLQKHYIIQRARKIEKAKQIAVIIFFKILFIAGMAYTIWLNSTGLVPMWVPMD